MTRCFSVCRPIVALVLAFLFVAPGVYAGYSVVEIGVLSGDAMTTATDVNNAGWVVGQSIATGYTSYRAILWDPTTQSTSALTTSNGSAWGINDNNEVVGFYNVSSSLSHGFYWTTGGGLVDLTHPDQGSSQGSGAYDINSDSLIGGLAGYKYPPYGTRGVLWNGPSDAAPVMLPTLGGTMSEIRAVNSLGHAVGISTATSVPLAFFWDGSTMTGLGTLPGGARSYAYGMNDSDVIVGSSEGTGAGAVYWTYDGSSWTIHPLGGGWANDINNDGLIVGYNSTGKGTLWDSGVAIDLNTLIPAGSGWILGYAYGISDSGYIVGVGTLDGVQRGYLLAPMAPVPAPGALVLCAVGGALAAVTRRRKGS
ncbi:MAG: hypothetical protein V2A58_14555 [Planctomycetota bacterium]